MRAAGIDTDALVRSSLVSFLEGALLFGVFHGDLHGGNLFVLADGRTAMLDFGITGRLDEHQRLALLRLLVFGTTGDVRGAARLRSATSARSRPTPTSRRSSSTSSSTVR